MTGETTPEPPAKKSNYELAKELLDNADPAATPMAMLALIDKMTEFTETLEVFYNNLWTLQLRHEQMR